MNTREDKMPVSDLVMDVLFTSTGTPVLVQPNSPGRKTGYAYVGNPWFLPFHHPDYDEHWRLKDGDSVIGCEPFSPHAMPVADAYAKFRDDCEEAYIESLIEGDNWEALDNGVELHHGDVGDSAPLTYSPFSNLAK